LNVIESDLDLVTVGCYVATDQNTFSLFQCRSFALGQIPESGIDPATAITEASAEVWAALSSSPDFYFLEKIYRLADLPAWLQIPDRYA
jgi:hypothetical protein